MNKEKILPITMEIAGIVAIGVGVGVELATHADIGWAIVTIGSCFVAMGAVIWGKFMRRDNGK